MSIHIEDLTVRFKNSVTAIDHADLDIPNGIFMSVPFIIGIIIDALETKIEIGI